MEEMPQPGFVSAAPNQSLLKLRLLERTQSTDDARKWIVKFEIINSTAVFGPQFAKQGKTADGFSFDSFQEFNAGELIIAHAEYLGDAHCGIYQLSQPRLVDDLGN